MDAHRLRAPSPDGALLAEPPLAEAVNRLDANADRLALWNYDVQGRSSSRLRDLVRKQVVDRACSFLADSGLDVPDVVNVGRLVVTGHQPELFHPGVWVKNFAAAEVARRGHALALNLIVDNDIPKASSLKVPHPEGDRLRVERVAFDEWAGEVPYEDLDVQDESLFSAFPGLARSTLSGLVADPLLDEFWPRASNSARRPGVSA